MKVLLITSEWDLCPFIKRQVELLRKRNIEIDVFVFRGKKSPFQYLRAWIRLRKMFSISKYDLIHANFGQSALLAMPLIKPLVVSFHGADLLGIKRKNGKNTFKGFVLQLWSKYVSKLAANVTIVSHEMAKNLPKSVKYHLLPCGVDLDLFKPASSQQCRKNLNLSSDKKLILFGGRPERLDKRLWLAKKSVSEISRQYNAELVTMSSVPYEIVPEYINACDLVLLTSKQEGSPNIIKEALACNVPVVSVNVGDVHERTSNIKGCFISESDSPAHITKALVKGLNFNEEFRGRETVIPLSEDKVIDQLVGIYRESIPGKKKMSKTS